MPVILSRHKFDYICEQDLSLDKSDQTIFKLQTLSSKESATAQSFLIKQETPAFVEYVCSQGLCGWENLKDQDGREVSFEVGSSNTVSPKVLWKLPHDCLQDVAMKIYRESNATPEQKGK